MLQSLASFGKKIICNDDLIGFTDSGLKGRERKKYIHNLNNHENFGENLDDKTRGNIFPTGSNQQA